MKRCETKFRTSMGSLW